MAPLPGLPYGEGHGFGAHVTPREDAPAAFRESVLEQFMAPATISCCNLAKGFGVIQPKTSGPDVLVHLSAVEQVGLSTLNDGQKASFDLEYRRQGKTAPLTSTWPDRHGDVDGPQIRSGPGRGVLPWPG